VLPGLVKRRTAEGQLYLKPDGVVQTIAEIPELTTAESVQVAEAPAKVEAVQGKTAAKSTTVWAAVASGVAGAGGAIKEVYENATDTFGGVWGMLTGPTLLWTMTAVGIGGCAWWIVRERARKAADDAV